MATLNFRIKGKADPATIFIRFRSGKEIDCEVSTKILVNRKHWSETQAKVKTVSEINYKKINADLIKLQAHILEAYNNDNGKGQPINSKWLKEQINTFFNRPTETTKDIELFFIPFVEDFIEYSKSRTKRDGESLSKRTIQHYTTTLSKIKLFQKHHNLRLRIEDINLNFHSLFLSFLETEFKLNPNTQGGYIDDIKLFCDRADRKGYKVNLEYKYEDFYSPSNSTSDIYLNESEIEKIYNLDLSNKDYLDNARDWFIIGLWTGLRISDFLNLSNSSLNDGFIQIKTKKTKYPVIIPIHEQVKQTLKKRNGNFPRKISDQKFNNYIKLVCKEANFNELTEGAKVVKVKTKNGEYFRKVKAKYPKFELVTSHICRRSFASNHYNKIDTMTLMKITGHKTESMFLSYLKITPTQYAEKLKNYWKEQEYLKSKK